jgi:hypothetical protein
MRCAMIAAALWPPGVVLFALGAPLALALPAIALGGASISLFDVWWQTALAERIPPQRLSRVSAYDWTVSIGLLPAGYALAGPLSHALGAVNVLFAGSAIACLVYLLGLLPRETRMLERLGAGDAARAQPLRVGSVS